MTDLEQWEKVSDKIDKDWPDVAKQFDEMVELSNMRSPRIIYLQMKNFFAAGYILGSMPELHNTVMAKLREKWVQNE